MLQGESRDWFPLGACGLWRATRAGRRSGAETSHVVTVAPRGTRSIPLSAVGDCLSLRDAIFACGIDVETRGLHVGGCAPHIAVCWFDPTHVDLKRERNPRNPLRNRIHGISSKKSKINSKKYLTRALGSRGVSRRAAAGPPRSAEDRRQS